MRWFIAIPLHLFGWMLSLTSFYRLGVIGTYEGDCFGFLFDEMITAFPFGFVPHPMYFGGACLFISSAIFYHSSTGLFLSLWSIVVYYFFCKYIEGPFTCMLYDEKAKNDKTKQEETIKPRKDQIKTN